MQYFMNKPKLIALYKLLDQKTDSLSTQNQVNEVFKSFDQAVDRAIRISPEKQLTQNLWEMGGSFLKSFKDGFLDKVVQTLEQELPASDNKVEPLYLEVIFRLQLIA